MKTVFEDAISRLKHIGEKSNISKRVLDALCHPKMTLSADIEIKKDDGQFEFFSAYRCRYNDVLGPTKGGIRFHPSVNEDEVCRAEQKGNTAASVGRSTFGVNHGYR